MSKRSDEVEDIAVEWLMKRFGLAPQYIDTYECTYKSGNSKALLDKFVDVKNYYTPDLIISNSFQEKTLAEMLFVQINEPNGTLFAENNIGIAQQISSAIDELKETKKDVSVHINPENMPVGEWITSQLRTKYNSYCLNRKGKSKGGKSRNAGIIFCMHDERTEKNKNTCTVNLSELQQKVLLSELCFQLSGNKLSFSDIEISYRNRFLSFKFCEKFELLSFVCIVGRESNINNDYIFINDKWLKNSTNIIAKFVRGFPVGNGNILFKNGLVNPDLISLEIDLHNVSETDIFYPYGKPDFQGTEYMGIPLQPQKI